MSVTPLNTLFICSDEHRYDALGCAGHPLVKTPHLDALAARGTRFTSAYTPSPICVPARAALATGRYVHQTSHWDSVAAYGGEPAGWAHRLRDAGQQVESIGKLHYRQKGDDHGFHAEHAPMYIVDGVGWIEGLLRQELGDYPSAEEYATDIGPGHSPYTRYDERICAAACQRIEELAATEREQPWTLYVSFVSPHYPLRAPQPFYDLYDPQLIPPPRFYDEAERSTHPVLAQMRAYMNYDDYFNEETWAIGIASYYGLCSYLDHLIGKLLETLSEVSLTDSTRIIYTSDHGDCLGDRGNWAKSLMYEESAAVPLIMAGPDVPQAATVETPVSLLDLYPTLLSFGGIELTQEEQALPGSSLLEIAKEPPENRSVMSEYHDGGAIVGIFMLRWNEWKYVYYPGYPAQLFNLLDDPNEARDLGAEVAYQEMMKRCHAELLRHVDPDDANARAFADQAVAIAAHGGVEAIRATKGFGFTPLSD